MNVKIPSMCKGCIDDGLTIILQYLLHPEPPLISDPGIIGMLSKVALSCNLETYVAINLTIASTGPRSEMEVGLAGFWK
ncbi:hypothetical protein J3R83DRAFT_12589 [Lanmaoa asiatica]|nr:hypothetical protein J3R83DRAFT_12589 [Lanmaoa asiatica]